jgi:hypothetical protein
MQTQDSNAQTELPLPADYLALLCSGGKTTRDRTDVSYESPLRR